VPADPTDLASWPAPPDAPTLAELEHLLPPEPFTAGPTYRSSTEQPPEAFDARLDQYLQAWLADGERRSLTIDTTLTSGAAKIVDRARRVDVEPWSEAWLLEPPPGEVPLLGLTLVSDSGAVHLQSSGLETETVLAIARSLERIGDTRPGWTSAALPADLVAAPAAWGSGAVGVARQTVVRYENDRPIAELDIAIGAADLVPGLASIGGPAFTFDEIDGSRAVVLDLGQLADGGPTYVTWSPAPEQLVRFGYSGGTEQTLALARELTPVDRSVWEAIQPFPPGQDGCRRLSC
jgi:DNA-binding XRE family transcriptional regulator